MVCFMCFQEITENFDSPLAAGTSSPALAPEQKDAPCLSRIRTNVTEQSS